MRTLLVAVCLLAVAGCKEDGLGPTVPLNQRFTLERGQTSPLEGTSLRIQFVGVTGDSRCPADVVCIQGGDALVQIRVTEQSAPKDYELHTGDSSQASVKHGDLTIELVELQPYPFSSRTIQPGDYRATLRVRR